MTAVVVVPVLELTEKTTGRVRGKEALDSLKARLASHENECQCLTIDLTVADIVTGSFLDELVLRMRELPSNVEIAFRIGSEEEGRRLEKICTLRDAVCHYQIGKSGPLRTARRRRASERKPEAYPTAFFTA